MGNAIIEQLARNGIALSNDVTVNLTFSNHSFRETLLTSDVLRGYSVAKLYCQFAKVYKYQG